MKIIPFPTPTKGSEPKVTTKPTGSHVRFTCTECKTTSELDFSGMIFRTVEIYCSCCNAFYKVSNPLLQVDKKPKKKK